MGAELTWRLQPRQGKGSPTGGQWEAMARVTAEATLRETDKEYNADGTYFFPPRPRSAAQHIAFWENVPVPDSVLAKVSKGFEHNRTLKINQHVTKTMEAWRKAHPEPPKSDRKRYGPWINAEAEEWSRVEAEEIDRWPGHINIMDTRAIVRSFMMVETASVLPPEELELVHNHPMPIWGKEYPAKYISDAHHMSDLRELCMAYSTLLPDRINTKLAKEIAFWIRATPEEMEEYSGKHYLDVEADEQWKRYRAYKARLKDLEHRHYGQQGQ